MLGKKNHFAFEFVGTSNTRLLVLFVVVVVGVVIIIKVWNSQSCSCIKQLKSRMQFLFFVRVVILREFISVHDFIIMDLITVHSMPLAMTIIFRAMKLHFPCNKQFHQNPESGSLHRQNNENKVQLCVCCAYANFHTIFSI